ncbi:branched-chain amino acid transport system substrate-binding protein [Enhydrobacter aerosaccus]|uniref:Branched-chain amino acid transport system substrate-binding protein n=1 Tax=Enhydrobacter aerosaccus TaxID=225324 RepID=A0A1T4JK79_9HYPH|nr:ABC transporter substrate-binding protein [Enhydrobacter aerosaccus]SJZ30571.1 branched-chain amino acid transport system substrate-binding protein [Enhydrobacter aerosaccus]
MAVKQGVQLAVISLLASVAIAQTSAAQVPGVTADTIRIGSFGALTGPGYLYGKLPMNGIEAVFDEVNAAGGVNGRKLQLVREDDRCDPAAAIGAVKKLISEDNVFALIGGGCSNATFAARDALDEAKIPLVVMASVHDGITTPVSPTIFSAALTSTIESEAQLLYAISQKAKRIAVISMRDAWGRARYTPLMEAFKKRGITPVADEEMAPDANDATAQVLRLKAANADAVLIVLYPKPAAIFMRDAQKLGYKPLAIGQTGIADPAAFEEQVGSPGATALFRTISMVRYTPEDPAMDKWRKAIETKFSGDRLSVFNLFGIGSAQVMVEALKRAGRDLTREKLVAALNHLTNFPTDVYGAGITCTETDHRCNKAPVWIAKEPGKPVRVLEVTKVE